MSEEKANQLPKKVNGFDRGYGGGRDRETTQDPQETEQAKSSDITVKSSYGYRSSSMGQNSEKVCNIGNNRLTEKASELSVIVIEKDSSLWFFLW